MASHYFASHGGGVEIVAQQLYREFAAAGHEVLWIAGDSTHPPMPIGRARPCPVPVFNFVENRMGVPFPIVTFGALQKIKAEIENADILLLHDCLYISNIAAFRGARKRGLPIIVVQHIGIVPYKNSVLRMLMNVANATITRPMLRRASQTVFISETTKNFFAGTRFARPPKVIFNGVDSGLFRPLRSDECKTELRERYELPVDRPVILFVGRFVEKKGIAILKHMAELRPGWTWAFAGWGPVNPSSWLASNVRVFSGFQQDAIAELYRASDVLALPSTGEGFPLVVQEAMSSGLSVVCSTETASADPELGRLVRGVQLRAGDDKRSAHEFIAAIEKTLASEDRAQVEQRRDFALSRYSWTQAAQQYLEIVAHLMSQGSHRGINRESQVCS
jgi:glycosyltransferase involved in cell wall biosynthesis